MEIRKITRKTWNFIWKDDSPLSWVVSLILAFLIVKFVFFPLLSIILATSMPLVVVESSSMEHPGTFIGNVIGTSKSLQLWWDEKGEWYEDKGIELEDTESWTIKGGLDIGDIVIVSGHDEPQLGDIIIFNANQKYPIIHRIVEIKEVNGETVYATKGDNNDNQLYTEKQIPEDVIVGRAVGRVPKLGWLKLAFVKIAESVR